MLVCLLILMVQQPPNLYRMQFDGSDRELAQGAIERHDLLHREIEPRLFLISVEEGTATEWEQRLTDAVPKGGGRFHGAAATPDEIERVRRGEIQLQR